MNEVLYMWEYGGKNEWFRRELEEVREDFLEKGVFELGFEGFNIYLIREFFKRNDCE